MEIAVPVVMFLLLLVLGMPVGFALGASGALGLFLSTGFDPMMGILSSSPYRSSASFLFTTLPMFILMAELAAAGGLARDLFSAAYKWIGHLPGGLGVATVLASAGFGAMSGSSTAGAAAMSSIAIPEMLRFGYNRSLAAGVVAIAGTLSIMIPPSIGFVLYGIITETSIGKLLIAGILPGALTAVVYSVGIVLWVKLKPGAAATMTPCTWKERWSSLNGLWPVIVLFGLVVGGLYSGLATPTEVAAVGAAGALVISVALRRLDFDGIKLAFKRTVAITAMIFTIIIGAMIFGYFLTVTGTITSAVGAIGSLPVHPWVILLLIILLYVLLGMFMDQIAIVLVTMPLTFPVVMELGFDPIWFGVIIVCVAEIGLVTPPVGMNSFVVSASAKIPLEDVFRGAGVMLIPAVVVLTLLLAFPEIALWLPSLMR